MSQPIRWLSQVEPDIFHRNRDFNECIFKYLNKHRQDVQIQPCKYTDIFRRLLGIPQSQSKVCHKYLNLQVNESTIVPGGTPYNGPYG